LIRRHLAFCIVIALVLTVGLTAYAEYTRSARARRVIGAYESPGSLFSSNYLIPGESINNRRTIYVSSVDSPLTGTLTVCNYPQGNPTKFYGRAISYTLQWRLVTVTDDEVVPYAGASLPGAAVQYGGNDANGTYTLAGGISAKDSFSLSFDSGMLSAEEPVYLEITATPDDGYADLPEKITGLFDVAVKSPRTAVAWQGYFGDDTGTLPPDYDGFNYVITGSGAGTCTLRWDGTKIAPSALFLQVDLAGTTVQTGGDGWSYVEFSVDSDVLDRYDLQFYRVPDSTWAGVSWADLAAYTALEFTAAEEAAEGAEP
jgi:hypothetical protein